MLPEEKFDIRMTQNDGVKLYANALTSKVYQRMETRRECQRRSALLLDMAMVICGFDGVVSPELFKIHWTKMERVFLGIFM